MWVLHGIKNRSLGCRGLTLVELMVALVLTAIIGGAVYKGLIDQTRNFALNDQVAEAQQNCRIATENIVREARSAGYAMTHASMGTSGQWIMDETGRRLVMFNSQGVLTGTQTLLNGTTLQTNNNTYRSNTDALVLRRGDSASFGILQFNPHPHHGDWWQAFLDKEEIDNLPIRANDYVLLIDVNRQEYRAMKVQEKGLPASDDPFGDKKKVKLHLSDYTGSFASTYGVIKQGGADIKTDWQDYGLGKVVKLKMIAYFIDSIGGVPTLMAAVNDSAAQVMAKYVEDLQIAYETYDDVSKLYKWYRGGTGTEASDPPDRSDIRTIRINVLARARSAGQKSIYSQSALEDGSRHPAAGMDGYARRVLTTMIKVRNYGTED